MSKYLCLQRSIAGNKNNEEPSPQQMQEMYAAFQTWQSQFQSQLIDMGGQLGEGTMVSESPIVDGPFVEVKELVGGYMIVEANNLDEAVEVARGCPGLVSPGSGVEVIEIHGQ
jgi:hypothetical protein